jgi:hypothetical protein
VVFFWHKQTNSAQQNAKLCKGNLKRLQFLNKRVKNAFENLYLFSSYRLYGKRI